jgi:hypothetical protein
MITATIHTDRLEAFYLHTTISETFISLPGHSHFSYHHRSADKQFPGYDTVK